MVNGIPKRIDEVSIEDIQDIQKDVYKLAQKYIAPVDAIRSIAKPRVSFGAKADDGSKDLDISNSKRLESRAHAFLRYIGFPVVAGTAAPGKFYNPGFRPAGTYVGTANQTFLIIDVFNKFNNDSVLKNMVDTREADPLERLRIFARRDTTSSIYTLALCSVIRNFKMFDSEGAFKDNLQKVESEDRAGDIKRFFSDESFNQDTITSVTSPLVKTSVGKKVAGIRHILHPFIVDPNIDNTVMPEDNQIAVPFLKDKEALKIDKDKYILRPGIEVIIKERLRDNANEAKNFFKNVENLLKSSKSPVSNTDTRTENELRLIVQSLLDDNKISQEAINSDIKGITNVQFIYITALVKTIRAVINSLKKYTDIIDKSINEINWVPIPSSEGPEMGVKDAILNRDGIASNTDLDNRILNNKITKMNAENRITENTDLGNYASPFSSYANDLDIKKASNNIRILTSKRDKAAENAFRAMGAIEIISGEVSGLGLLDILAIYTALWSVEEKALISLLDDQSFSRLRAFFPDLIKGAAKARDESNDVYTIQEALEKFEKKLVNIFAFIDGEIEDQGLAPGEKASGSISADS